MLTGLITRCLVRVPVVWMFCGLVAGCTAANQDYCPAGSPACPADPGTDGADLGELPMVDLAGLPVDPPLPDLAGAPALDPDVAGPYKVAKLSYAVTVSGGSSQVTVMGPSDDGTSLSKTRAPHPLVVFSPGFTLDRSLFEKYGQRLASYGIVTALQKVPNEFNHSQYRENTVELITFLLNPTGRDSEKLKGAIDANRIGVSGHSLGGKIGLLAAQKDSRIKAYIGIDPVDNGSPLAATELAALKFPGNIPVGFLGETVSKSGGMPCAPANGNFEVLYGKASAPAFAINFVGAAHMDFVDNPNCGFQCNVCPGSVAPKDRTNRLAIKYVTAYFLWALAGDSRGASFLVGAENDKDVTARYVTRVSK